MIETKHNHTASTIAERQRVTARTVEKLLKLPGVDPVEVATSPHGEARIPRGGYLIAAHVDPVHRNALVQVDKDAGQPYRVVVHPNLPSTGKYCVADARYIATGGLTVLYTPQRMPNAQGGYGEVPAADATVQPLSDGQTLVTSALVHPAQRFVSEWRSMNEPLEDSSEIDVARVAATLEEAQDVLHGIGVAAGIEVPDIARYDDTIAAGLEAISGASIEQLQALGGLATPDVTA